MYILFRKKDDDMKKILAVTLTVILALTLLGSALAENDLLSIFANQKKEEEKAGMKSAEELEAEIEELEAEIARKDEEIRKLEKLALLKEIMENIQQECIADVDEGTLLDGAARGMIESLGDKGSSYYTPEEYEAMLSTDSETRYGIGVTLQADRRKNTVEIIRTFAESPARKAGIRKGDILYKVDDFGPVTQETLFKAVNLLKGRLGSEVRVTVLRDGQEMEFTVARGEVEAVCVESYDLGDGIGYSQVFEIASGSGSELQKDILTLKTVYGLRGLVIDLRSNNGGWIDEARFVADLFLDKGVLGRYLRKDGTEQTEGLETKDGTIGVEALAVLVDEDTAGAAEYLAQALREKAGAVVVGETTYGLGTISGVFEPAAREGAGYQISMAEFVSPDGLKINDAGVTPDVIVEADVPEGETGADYENDEQLRKAMEILREILDKADAPDPENVEGL